jgi:hypothetical protein
MTLLNKIVEDSIRQSKLLAQMSEQSYRALNGTRQTRTSFTNNYLKEKLITVTPAIGSLTSETRAQYKREELEENKYVDPTTKREFRFAPAGTVPTLIDAALVDVPSLGAPATHSDLEREETNFAKILEDINYKNKEIIEKEEEIIEKEEEIEDEEMENKEQKRGLKSIADTVKKLEKERLEKDGFIQTAMTNLATLQAISTPTAKDKTAITRLS